MEKITGNEPAHPCKSLQEMGIVEITVLNPGITIRQQFAAMAMQGILATSDSNIQNLSDENKALYACIMADNLITELNKEA